MKQNYIPNNGTLLYCCRELLPIKLEGILRDL